MNRWKFHRFNKLKHSVIAQPLVAQLHQKTYFLLPLFKYFFPKTLEVTRKSRIFVEELRREVVQVIAL